MYLDRNKTQSLIDAGKARGISGEDVLNGLIERGYEPEGIDVAQARTMIASTKAQNEGGLAETADDFKQIGSDVSAAITDRSAKLNTIDSAKNRGEQGAFRSFTQSLGQGAGMVSDTIGAVVKGVGKALLPESAERAVGEGFTKYAATIADKKISQEGTTLYQDLAAKDPALARDLETAMNFAFLAGDVGGAGVLARPVSTIAKGTAEVVGDAVQATGKVTAKAGAVPGFAASEVQGALTGTSGETIRQAFDAARRGGDELRAYTDALRKQTTPEQLVNKMREATDTVKGENSARFGEMIDQIGDAPVSTTGLVPESTKDLARLGVQVGSDGKLDFSGSKFRTVPEAQKKLQAAYDEVLSLGEEQTVKGVDTSRQALSALLLTGDDASARTANLAITNMIDRVRTAGKQVDGYSQALEQFGENAEFLDEISRALSAGDKATVDTAYRKLATSLKTNNEQRMALLKELDEATGGYLLSSIAGQQLSEELPRGLFRQIAAGLAVGGVATGGVSAAMLPTFLFASPRAAGEVLRALGIATGKVDGFLKAINKVRSDLNIIPVADVGDNK